MDASAFVVKADLFMRMANISHLVKHGAKYLKMSPKGKSPVPLRWLIPSIIRRTVKKNLHGQAVARHTAEEILARADKSLQSLSTLLADKDFFFGEQHTSFDAVVYSHFCEFISVPFDSGFENVFTKKAKSYQNLVQFYQRIEDTFYQEK